MGTLFRFTLNSFGKITSPEKNGLPTTIPNTACSPTAQHISAFCRACSTWIIDWKTPPTHLQSNFKTLKVTALDLSLFNLQMAKQKLGGLDGVTFEESNAEHMAVPNESQDLVTCNFVLSTVPSEARVRCEMQDRTEGRGVKVARYEEHDTTAAISNNVTVADVSNPLPTGRGMIALDVSPPLIEAEYRRGRRENSVCTA